MNLLGLFCQVTGCKGVHKLQNHLQVSFRLIIQVVSLLNFGSSLSGFELWLGACGHCVVSDWEQDSHTVELPLSNHSRGNGKGPPKRGWPLNRGSSENIHSCLLLNRGKNSRRTLIGKAKGWPHQFNRGDHFIGALFVALYWQLHDCLCIVSGLW